MSRRRNARQRSNRKRSSRQPEGVRVGAPGARAEGADAGPDDDLRERYVEDRVRGYRGLAKRRFENAKRLVRQGSQLAEREARRAIDAAARAFWWAEDTPAEEAQHQLMHSIGRWTRRTFGCQFDYQGGRYTQRCPIAIAHKRLGLSIGFIGTRMCSICGEDLSQCEHVRGRTYWVRGGSRAGRRCPVCLQEDCRHRPDRLYRAGVVSVITEISEQREVSLVSRPADPEARLLEIPVDKAGLAQRFGPAFQEGVEINCDLCLGDCWGFDERLEESRDPAAAGGDSVGDHPRTS